MISSDVFLRKCISDLRGKVILELYLSQCVDVLYLNAKHLHYSQNACVLRKSVPRGLNSKYHLHLLKKMWPVGGSSCDQTLKAPSILSRARGAGSPSNAA